MLHIIYNIQREAVCLLHVCRTPSKSIFGKVQHLNDMKAERCPVHSHRHSYSLHLPVRPQSVLCVIIIPWVCVMITPWTQVHWSHSSGIVGGTPLPQTLSLLLSFSVVSDSLRPHGPQHTRLPCPSPSPRICSNSGPSSRWCHPTISSSVVPFSSRLQSFPASGSLPGSQLFASGGQCRLTQCQEHSLSDCPAVSIPIGLFEKPLLCLSHYRKNNEVWDWDLILRSGQMPTVV